MILNYNYNKNNNCRQQFHNLKLRGNQLWTIAVGVVLVLKVSGHDPRPRGWDMGPFSYLNVVFIPSGFRPNLKLSPSNIRQFIFSSF